jgi:hypothetical protein
VVPRRAAALAVPPTPSGGGGAALGGRGIAAPPAKLDGSPVRGAMAEEVKLRRHQLLQLAQRYRPLSAVVTRS